MRRRLIVATALTGLLMAAEGVARLVEAHPAPPGATMRSVPFGMFRSDDAAGVALAKQAWIPGERFGTNSFGHRDRPRTAGEPAPWSTRIAVIGGSMAAGRGVSDAHTFTRLLEDAFPRAVRADDERPREVEVWNLGVPGYGAEQALLRLEADWESVQPDLVVWAFEMGETPIRTLLGPGARTVRDGELLSGPWRPFAAAPYEDERAGVLHGGVDIGPFRLQSALVRAAGRSSVGVLSQVPPGMDPFRAAPAGAFPWLWTVPEPEPVGLAWELVGDVLLRMKASCVEQGAELVLLALPGRPDLGPEYLASASGARLLLDDGAAPVSFEAGLPGRRLSSLAQAHAVPLIDATSALIGAAEPVVFDDFPTLNAAGHRVLAATLAEGLGPGVRIPPFDPIALNEALFEAVPSASSDRLFDGGFRAGRGRADPVVRWERLESWAW